MQYPSLHKIQKSGTGIENLQLMKCFHCFVMIYGLSVLSAKPSVSMAQQNTRPTPTAAFKIAYSTYLGGSRWDQAREVIVLPDGSVVIGAQTASEDIPTSKDAVQPDYAGDDPSLGHGGLFGGDCYVAVLGPYGRRLTAATYFGGSKQERNVYGMALDRDGNVVITSATRSRDLPATSGSFQTRYGGGAADCFAAKLSKDLKRLLWCTYVGGSGDESPRGGLALDVAGNVCLFGTTNSQDYPVTAGVHSTKLSGPRDAAVTMLKSDGSGLVWSTLFGGSAADYMVGGRVGKSGDIYFAGHTTSSGLPGTAGAAQSHLGGGHDGYVVKLSKDAGHLHYVTYVGGSKNEFPEHMPLVKNDGSIFLPGVTLSSDFPTTPDALRKELKGNSDAFLFGLSPKGDHALSSTLLGGSAGEFCLMPTPGPSGEIFIVGQTDSRDLPVTSGALQKEYGGGKSDGWLAAINSDGSEVSYCTYLGGSGDDMIRSIAVGSDGALYLVGNTSSDDFPVTEGALQTSHRGKGDAYVLKLVPTR